MLSKKRKGGNEMAKAKSKSVSFGGWAYLIGVIVAVVLGIAATAGALWSTNEWLLLLLVIIGLVIGFANITTKEVVAFLIASMALIITSIAGLTTIDTLIPYLGTFLQRTVSYVVVVIAPAALIVSLKAIWALASNK